MDDDVSEYLYGNGGGNSEKNYPLHQSRPRSPLAIGPVPERRKRGDQGRELEYRLETYRRHELRIIYQLDLVRQGRAMSPQISSG